MLREAQRLLLLLLLLRLHLRAVLGSPQAPLELLLLRFGLRLSSRRERQLLRKKQAKSREKSTSVQAEHVAGTRSG
jgi:hypothetical protein